MTNVDQFESVFRSAAREVFDPQPVVIDSVLVITDLEEYDANLFAERVKGFLRVLDPPGEAGAGTTWRTVRGDEYRTVPELLDLVERGRPDLICTYRHLQTDGWQWPMTLGDHLEVLTQVTSTPVVVLPHPKADRASEHAVENTNMVMAMTDHLVGDNRLVSYAARFTEADGTLFLAHVENEAALDRVSSRSSRSCRTFRPTSPAPRFELDCSRTRPTTSSRAATCSTPRGCRSRSSPSCAWGINSPSTAGSSTSTRSTFSS